VSCRVCGGRDLGPVVDLGRLPLVNDLAASPDAACPRWPLRVVFCRDCSLVQITDAPPPEAMFRRYCYFSSQSRTMVAHAGGLVRRFVRPGARVLEVASNDGYLLAQAQAAGATVLGVDPAENVAAAANARGVPTRCAYFDRATARAVRDDWGPADVLFANNVLAHVPDPNELAAAIGIALAADGTAHVEVPYVVPMVRDGAFDTIYHEHHCYFSVTALRVLFHRHDLRLRDVRVVDVHGGSLHLQVARAGAETAAERLVEDERRLGIGDDRFYAPLARRVPRRRAELARALDEYEWVAAYGAAAKGVVLLNVCGLEADRIRWVADVSPHKQGRYVPGTGQPIVPPARLVEDTPPACLLLPWNLREEIVAGNRAYVERGGRFIVPMPEVAPA
jgi:SAM-dependent methyltransferase